MCRKQKCLGYTLIAGGVGILLSLLLASTFWSVFFAAGLIAGGILTMGK